MNIGIGIPATWLPVAFFLGVEVALFVVWKVGRLGLRATAFSMAYVGLLGVFWIRPTLMGLVLPIPHAGPGTYTLWDALFLTVLLLATMAYFAILGNRQHLIALTREIGLEGARGSLESWANTPKSGPRVAVVIPAKDEQTSLPAVLAMVRRNPATSDQRVIVVDDGSSDWTGGIARDFGAITLRHAHALGIGGALTTGFLAALQSRADIIVQMDADGQHDPAALPSLVGPILLGQADFVIATRQENGSFPTLSRTRRAGIHLYTGLVRRMSGYPLTDLTSGYRAIRATKLPAMLFISEKNWAIEQTLRAGKARVSMVEVSVPGLPRLGGKSQFHDITTFFLYHLRAVAQIYRALYLPNVFASPHLHERPVPVPRPVPASPAGTPMVSHPKSSGSHNPVPERGS